MSTGSTYCGGEPPLRKTPPPHASHLPFTSSLLPRSPCLSTPYASVFLLSARDEDGSHRMQLVRIVDGFQAHVQHNGGVCGFAHGIQLLLLAIADVAGGRTHRQKNGSVIYVFRMASGVTVGSFIL